MVLVLVVEGVGVQARGEECRTCGGRVRRRVHGHGAHVLLQATQLVLESLVPSEEVLDRAVTALVAAELVELALEALNVLLCAGADGTLGLAVVGPLAGQLRRREGGHASGACRFVC